MAQYRMNAAIITARGGNQSIPDKNLIPIFGRPVISYPIQAALLARRIDRVYCTTDCDGIAHRATLEGAQILRRPEELTGADVPHAPVIQHAVQEIKWQHPELKNCVVLLGNTVHVGAHLIDQALGILDDRAHDSVATVWQAQDDHPLRALELDENGHARNHLRATPGSNRQTYPPVYYYDQGIWAFRWNCAAAGKGPAPWTWLGERCALLERPWPTGRDIHGPIDISASIWHLTHAQPFESAHFLTPPDRPAH